MLSNATNNNGEETPTHSPRKFSRLRDVRDKINSKKEASVERYNSDLQKVENLEHLWKESKELLNSSHMLLSSVDILPHSKKNSPKKKLNSKNEKSEINKKKRTPSIDSSKQKNLNTNPHKNSVIHSEKSSAKKKTAEFIGEQRLPNHAPDNNFGTQMLKSNLNIKYRLRPSNNCDSNGNEMKALVKKVQEQYTSPYSQKEAFKSIKQLQKARNDAKIETISLKKSDSENNFKSMNIFKKNLLFPDLTPKVGNFNNSVKEFPKPSKSQSIDKKHLASTGKIEKFSFASPRITNPINSVSDEISLLNTTSNSQHIQEQDGDTHRKKKATGKKKNSLTGYKSLYSNSRLFSPATNNYNYLNVDKKKEPKAEKKPVEKIPEKNDQLKSVLKSKITNFVSEIEKYNDELYHSRAAVNQKPHFNFIPQINNSCKTLLRLLKVQQTKI